MSRRLGLLAASAALAALLTAPPASATLVQFDLNANHVQCDSGCSGGVAWTPSGDAALAVTTATARVALANTDTVAILINTGTAPLYWKLGNGSVTAATTDHFLAAGGATVVKVAAGQTNIAAITASGTATLGVQQGAGNPFVAGGGGGGAGGAATIAAGADVTEGNATDGACAGDATSGCTVESRLIRLAQRLTTIDGEFAALATAVNQTTQISALGAPTDAACAGDATSGCTIEQRLQRIAQRLTIIDGEFAALATAANQIPPYAATPSTGVTRPANTTAYTINTAWADSTSAPTAGGFTFTGACRTSGGHGVLVSLSVTSSIDPTTLLQAELWAFDSAPTAINDAAAFSISDSDQLKRVFVVPFTLASSNNGSGTNSVYDAGSLNFGYVCSGSANLRYLVKIKNAYTPASGEVLTFKPTFAALD